MNRIELLALLLLFSVSNVNSQIEFRTYSLTDTSTSSHQTEDARGSDIDGDGDLDIVACSRLDDKIAWYENIDGLGTFGPQRIVSLEPDEPLEVFTADLDGDGDQDILSASGTDNTVGWYENLDGAGNFGPRVIINNNTEDTDHVQAADLDGDGDLDVVNISDGTPFLFWYENTDGLGTFGPPIVISTVAGNGVALELGDVDGDNDIDVIASKPFDDVFWYENDGNGSFSAEQLIDQSVGVARDLELGDMDGDGDMDLVAASSDSGELKWYPNLDGAGTFGTEIIINSNATYPLDTFLMDVDNDSDLDVVAAVLSDRQFIWHENLDGAGNFGPPQIIFEGGIANRKVFLDDFDGDGTPDLITTTSGGGGIIGLHRNPGYDGMFTDRELVNNSYFYPEVVEINDVDNDGDQDFMFGLDGGVIGWLENTNGQGSFDTRMNLISSQQSNIKYFVNEDIDGDGDLDVVASARSPNASIGWYENLNGAGDYGPLQEVFSNGLFTVNEVHAFDFDGDEDLDLLACSLSADALYWFENTDGQGNFGPSQQINSTLTRIGTTYAADVDGDGDLDVLATSDNTNILVWYENTDGLATFGPAQQLATSVGSEELRAIDLDNDGDEDILAAGTNSIRKLINLDGMGTFSVSNLSVSSLKSLRTPDMDNDGDPDIVYGSRFDGAVYWLENEDGNGNFVFQGTVAEGFESVYGVAAGDLDGDGDMDIASASRLDDKLSWHENFLASNLIVGDVGVDTVGDGCNPSDFVAPGVLIITESDTGESFGSFTQSNSTYLQYVGEGDYSTAPVGLPSFFTIVPQQHDTSFVGVGSTYNGDFCLEVDGAVDDVSVNIFPGRVARPGFFAGYYLVFRNQGSSTLSGTVDFEFDDTKLEYSGATQGPIALTSNSVTFEYQDLRPFERRWIYVRMNVFPPPTTDIGDILVFESEITPLSTDANPDNNIDVFEQEVIGSFDPNDIQVLEGETIFEDETDDYLHYIIRFQNIGTAEAINVRVVNPLDQKLDWTTMEIEGLSHDGVVEIAEGAQVDFIFDDINLPPQSQSEEDSQGFIAYKIKPISSIGLGESMSNNADIFFDFNPPIQTNTVTTTVIERLGVDEVGFIDLALYPVPSKDVINIASDVSVVQLDLFNELGQSIISLSDGDGIKTFSVAELSQGIYFVRLTDEMGATAIRKIVKQ